MSEQPADLEGKAPRSSGTKLSSRAIREAIDRLASKDFAPREQAWR